MKIEISSLYVVIDQDVRDGQNIKFLDAGEMQITQFGEKLMFKVSVPSGKEKLLRMNESSKKNMIEAYGAESEKWVGKEARVNIKMTRMGKSILLTHPNKDDEGNIIVQ